MKPDLWSVILDVGDFDVIFEESEDIRVCELFIEIHKGLAKTPFIIKRRSEVRKPNTTLVETYSMSNSIS